MKLSHYSGWLYVWVFLAWTWLKNWQKLEKKQYYVISNFFFVIITPIPDHESLGMLIVSLFLHTTFALSSIIIYHLDTVSVNFQPIFLIRMLMSYIETCLHIEEPKEVFSEIKKSLYMLLFIPWNYVFMQAPISKSLIGHLMISNGILMSISTSRVHIYSRRLQKHWDISCLYLKTNLL